MESGGDRVAWYAAKRRTLSMRLACVGIADDLLVYFVGKAMTTGPDIEVAAIYAPCGRPWIQSRVECVYRPPGLLVGTARAPPEAQLSVDHSTPYEQINPHTQDCHAITGVKICHDVEGAQLLTKRLARIDGWV
ncbi:hypothetical protein GCM10010404_66790 [Nonomuraea africana]